MNLQALITRMRREIERGLSDNDGVVITTASQMESFVQKKMIIAYNLGNKKHTGKKRLLILR